MEMKSQGCLEKKGLSNFNIHEFITMGNVHGNVHGELSDIK